MLYISIVYQVGLVGLDFFLGYNVLHAETEADARKMTYPALRSLP